MNIKDITTAQYIDYTETLKNDPRNIAMMCAIFCIPDGHTYNEGYHVTDLADEFYEHFKIVDAIGISFFHQTFGKLCKSYPQLFEMAAETGDQKSPGEQPEPGADNENPGEYNSFGARWWANIMLKQVIDYTGLTIHQVFDLPVIEFLNYAAYCKSYILNENKKNKKLYDKIKRR